MKKIILFFLTYVTSVAISQTTSTLCPAMINVAGGSGVVNSVYYDFTVGEPYTAFGGTSCDSIFSGFQHCAVDTLRIKKFNVAISGANTTVCQGSNIALSAQTGTAYVWSNSATTQSISVTISGIYTSSVTNSCGNMIVSNPVTITFLTPPTPDICEVTVDSLSQYNNIIWDKTPYNNADSFIVYREISTGIYKRIGAQDKNAFSLFMDTARSIGPANGDPNITSYRYKLQIRDTCGNYSALSPYHNSIYFYTNTTGTYLWNTYNVEFQGLTPVSTFDLYRDNFATGTWTLVGSCAGTQTSLTDPAFSSYTNAIYRVIGNGFSCNATAKTTQQINKSKSNVKNNFNILTGISAVTQGEIFTIAPNPASEEIIISFTSEVKEMTRVTVTNVLGKSILVSEIYEGKRIAMPLNELATGVYFIRVQQGKNYTDKKFIKN